MRKLEKVLHIKDPLKRAKAVCDVLKVEEPSEGVFIPVEPIQQIPEVFLSMKILPECETYFIQESIQLTEKEVEQWNTTVNKALEVLSFEIDIDLPPDTKKTSLDKEMISVIETVLGVVKK